jgi:CheY-like chemotaxis protein/anti-sigma regulatory factor (Ser/Thr protein kinase)
MSHEIRTPLNGVLGMAQLLHTDGLTGRQKSKVETILTSARALLALLEDVLDISKIEAGIMTLQPAPVSARTLLEETCSALSAAADEKGLRVELSVAPEADAPFSGDGRRIRQVLLNLAANAVKFTPTGAVQLRAQRREDRIRFEVADTGPGVPPAQREMIFDRFRQAYGGLDRSHDGAGLGLAISRELVQLAGGAIGVDDNPGGGALFWFELPYTPIEAESAPEPARAPASAAGTALIVEDNKINQMVIEATLLELGLEAVTVDSGAAALKASADQTFEIAVIDHHMPGMTGSETIRALRDRETGADRVPILLLTADAREETFAQAREAGADAWAGKPFDVPALQAQIARLIA